jgi:hypothetical protein
VIGKQNTLHNLLVLQTSENIRLKQFEKQYSCIQLRDNFMQRGLEKLIFPGFMGTLIILRILRLENYPSRMTGKYKVVHICTKKSKEAT